MMVSDRGKCQRKQKQMKVIRIIPLNKITIATKPMISKNQPNRSLDEAKDNIKKSLDESKNQIPKYNIIVNRYQEQSLQIARDFRGVYQPTKRNHQLTSISLEAIQ